MLTLNITTIYCYMLNAVMLSVIKLNVVMLSVVMLNVMALGTLEYSKFLQKEEKQGKFVAFTAVKFIKINKNALKMPFHWSIKGNYIFIYFAE